MEQRDTEKALHPAGLVSEPGDIAAFILALASDRAKFITRQRLAVDGSMTVKMR